MDGWLGSEERLAPVCLCPFSLSLSPFFLIVVRDQPLRLGEMLHLVREEILLRPLYDPNPLFSSSASAGGHEGWVGVSLPPRPPASNTMLPLLF